ncbi:type II secretion system protein GspM [Massilia endophytica]|uniref:type II secretion system protein GspM n=1 Tax=Massilia endophytica TaxID=2899220 RepID=UPI001E4CCF95|nr:type II secretion system protein GspM [Massilia endophytica]UGQ48377.1 type II secretion system protein M [Massilia endophytica]
MKEQWLKLAARIDALALRERIMIFAALGCMIVYLVYMTIAEPMMAKQKEASAQIVSQQQKIAELNVQIQERIASASLDPDSAARVRLERLLSEQTSLGTNLRTVQRGLVAPEKMAPLLERILQSHGRLKLMALSSLPVTTVEEAAPLTAAPPKSEAAGQGSPQGAQPAEIAQAVVAAAVQQAGAAGATPASPPAGAAAPAPVPAPKARAMLYRHGVELTLQGSYPDMVSYMEALEHLPVQLFWGRAQLDAENYPDAKLTLTLYTLSLDDKWMKL